MNKSSRKRSARLKRFALTSSAPCPIPVLDAIEFLDDSRKNCLSKIKAAVTELDWLYAQHVGVR